MIVPIVYSLKNSAGTQVFSWRQFLNHRASFPGDSEAMPADIYSLGTLF